MVYGYGRVSTVKQLKGNSLEDQRQQLTAEGATELFMEAYTGVEKSRPELSKLLAKVQAGDTVLVTKLDRLARNAKDGLEIIDDLLARGVNLRILNMGATFDNTPFGKLSRTILLAFAEYERDAILERMSAGKEIARAKGIKVDGKPPKFSEAQKRHALDLLASGLPYTQVARMTGISKSSLIRYHAATKGGNQS